MFTRDHRADIGFQRFNLLAVLKLDDPGAAFTRINIVANTQRLQHFCWRHGVVGWAGREIQR